MLRKIIRPLLGGERPSFPTRITWPKEAVDLRELLFLEKTSHKPSIREEFRLGKGEDGDGGLLDRIRQELGVRFNPEVLQLFGLKGDSTCQLILPSERRYVPTPLVFLFGEKDENDRIQVPAASNVIILERNLNNLGSVYNVRISGVVEDHFKTKRILAINYAVLPNLNIAEKIDISLKAQEEKRLPTMTNLPSSLTDIENPHRRAGLVTQKMVEEAGDNGHHSIGWDSEWQEGYRERYRINAGDYLSVDLRGRSPEVEVEKDDQHLGIHYEDDLVFRIPASLLPSANIGQ